jgi:hypothetical protein
MEIQKNNKLYMENQNEYSPLDNNNKKNTNIINKNEEKEIEPETQISLLISILILICNLCIPGLGTFIIGLLIKNKKLRNEFFCNALIQFITTPLLLFGWILALIYSIMLISFSLNKLPSQDDFRLI